MPSSLAPLRRALGWVRTELGLFVVLVGIGSLAGLLGTALLPPDDRRITGLIGGLVTLYLQLFVTARVLDGAGAMPPDYRREMATEARFPSAFLASLLSIVGIAAGLALLVVPGILLFGLRSMWMPALLAERLRTTEALRRSWRLAKPRLGWVLLASVWIVLAPMGLAIAIVVTLVLVTRSDVLPDTLVEPLVVAMQLLWAVSYASVYLTLRDEAGRVEAGIAARP